MKLHDKISNWISNYLIKNNLETLVIGISGGIDSAVTSTLCARTGFPTKLLIMPIYQNEEETNRGINHCDFLKKKYSNVENINIDLHELEDIGRNGYVNGMTNMILSRIRDLDVTKRPLHCTDLKRETMYIKDNDEWSKDTPENSKLRRMIDCVGKENYSKIPLWREKHPECEDWNNPKYDFCIDMMRNVLGDMGDDQIRLDNKVIKNLSKHIIVDK